MDFFQLETFLAVAQTKSFSAAATQVHRTQPAVSQMVRKLEEEIGEPLFDRSTRDGMLTDAGRVLEEYAQKLLNLRSEARSSLEELRSEERRVGKECRSRWSTEHHDKKRDIQSDITPGRG